MSVAPAEAPRATELEVSDFNWVANWGACRSCGALDKLTGDLCCGCERRRQAKRAAEAARLRPRAVIASPEGIEWGDDQLAVLTIPQDAGSSVILVASVIAQIASERLQAGDSLDFALRKVAAGRDLITRRLAERGVVRDRKTVARALEELVELGVLERTDQLATWVDWKAANTTEDPLAKSGAFVYELAIRFRELGALALNALCSLSSTRSFEAMQGVGGIRRAESCLEGALKHARVGNRNSGGYWLARRCIDAGLPLDQAAQVLDRYREGLAARGLESGYNSYEARATVKSAYRYHGAHAGRPGRLS